MSLTHRQNRLFGITVRIFKPVAPTGTPSLTQTAVTYPATPSYTAVRARYIPSPEIAHPAGAGMRMNQDMVFTLDGFEFLLDQDIDDGYAIQILTPTDHPEYLTYFITQGAAKVAANTGPRRPNYRMVSAKRSTRPPGVTS